MPNWCSECKSSGHANMKNLPMVRGLAVICISYSKLNEAWCFIQHGFGLAGF